MVYGLDQGANSLGIGALGSGCEILCLVSRVEGFGLGVGGKGTRIRNWGQEFRS